MSEPCGTCHACKQNYDVVECDCVVGERVLKSLRPILRVLRDPLIPPRQWWKPIGRMKRKNAEQLEEW